MAVSPVMNKSNASTQPATNQGNSAADLTQSFMTLLVAQMKNQDPINPMDNNQLTSQLAQFNTAAGVEKLNTTLEGVGVMVNSMQQMNASQWIGSSVFIEGDSVISGAQGGNKDFAFNLDSDASKVAVTLTDRSGNAYTADIKHAKAGVNKYTFDDLVNFTPSAPSLDASSVFKVAFSAANEDGSTPNITSLKKGKVDSVSFTNGGAKLQLGLNGSVPIGKVYLIE
ncbi:flagellar biosynthesis protein FlgD [Buttiauxella warmboldiae]|uniref:Basal-body rod modification protein FlgD n=1 Tax=Buttiauxella warmboldiae TaxID=82993 RepID=A0A3N5DNQ5_9ENTR|nr:flagellar hook capping FlgD N-terminal domain-containing protein [Buttiauxella warmboldiae]RPH29237.1 flagellar biosynthesis protein FlgD [Buttiauxella warmboldiae]